jgi:hypothetical protein
LSHHYTLLAEVYCLKRRCQDLLQAIDAAEKCEEDMGNVGAIIGAITEIEDRAMPARMAIEAVLIAEYRAKKEQA